MIRSGRVVTIAWYTWSGARRRWILFAPPALLVLLLLLQLPRIVHVTSLFDGSGGDWRAIAGFAELVEALYANCIVLGAIFAVGLGASSTGRRGLRHQVAPILARPLSRSEFVLGRTAGLASVLAVYWLIPAAVFESLRYVVGAPVRLNPFAYVVPFALHLLLLAAGMAAGSLLRTIPAAAVTAACAWGVLLLGAGAGSSIDAWRLLSAATRWVVPPLADLLRASAPFLSPATLLAHAALLVQTGAWVAILVVATVWRFERIDFGSRSA
jgi:hypothetical protein